VGPSPCVNDICVSSGDNCIWAHNSGPCYTEPPCMAAIGPECPYSVCVNNGTAVFWDDSPCDQTFICPTLDVNTCPFGRECANGQPGGCVLGVDGNCIWQCPVDTCDCSTPPTPPVPGSNGCAVWSSLCLNDLFNDTLVHGSTSVPLLLA